jgi:Conserved in the green lineage and diatoms 27
MAWLFDWLLHMLHFLCLCEFLSCYVDIFLSVWLRPYSHKFRARFCFYSCYPISGATWVNEGFVLQKLTASNIGALSMVFLLVLRLYSGWGYIGSRLQSKVVEFEETGWYDGDIEEKSEAEKARDLFLYRSNVQPVEERLKKFSLAIGGAWVASCLALNVATSMKPIFNQYDPQMLEKLSYDDKIADIVQQQSFGRPTYCENRYYRAVANGGQGCEK